MKYYTHWGTHLPILMKIIGITDGAVLELGMGMWSSPYLHWACFEKKRELVSCEANLEYLRMFKWFSHNDYHKMIAIKDWDKAPIERPWDVVLVDHDDIRRSIEIKRLANYAKYIIVHDTDPKAALGYEYPKIWPLFKYRYDYTKVSPNTSVLSNLVDLSNL